MADPNWFQDWIKATGWPRLVFLCAYLALVVYYVAWSERVRKKRDAYHKAFMARYAKRIDP